jgi:hypothetical protein
VSSLVGIFTNCGGIKDAQRVFDSMPTHNAVSWNAMILGYVSVDKGRRHQDLFDKCNLKRCNQLPSLLSG